MFNSDRAYEIRNDGLIIEDGAHYISGPLIPSHVPTVPTFYDRLNGERYFNDGLGGSWTLLGSNSGNSNQRYYIAPLETYIIPVGVSSVVTGPIDIEGIVILDGRLEIL